MRWFLLAGLGLGGCSEKEPGTCEAIAPGTWVIDGPAMGMEMVASLEVAAEACEFTFSDWSMEMLSLPIGGTVSGATVLLDGDAHWSTCSGELTDDGTSVTGGACDDDGTTFTMALDDAT